MNSRSTTRGYTLAAVVIAAVVTLAGSFTALAEEPMLAIRQVGGGSSIYAISEIERIDFENDTLTVVSSSGSSRYAAAAIIRIEFLWDFSDIKDPEEAASLLKAVHLFQNQPNPFSLETQIGFELPQAGEAELAIYSPDGRLMRRLVIGQRPAGHHTVRWDGLDDTGRQVPGGVYFYSLRAPEVQESRRMILLP
jgi:hypothetical protein